MALKYGHIDKAADLSGSLKAAAECRELAIKAMRSGDKEGSRLHYGNLADIYLKLGLTGAAITALRRSGRLPEAAAAERRALRATKRIGKGNGDAD